MRILSMRYLAACGIAALAACTGRSGDDTGSAHGSAAATAATGADTAPRVVPGAHATATPAAGVESTLVVYKSPS